MSKKTLILIFLSVSILLCFSACKTNDDKTDNISEKQTEASSPEMIDKNVGGTNDDLETPYDDYKYRAIYYSVSAPFVELVDEDVFWDWYNNSPYRKYPLDVDEMAMVAFIKKFNISREDFDKANKKDKEILLKYSNEVVMNPAEEDPYYDRSIESKEIYNADIIYTFDNELINAYYLYVDPYEDENSTAEDGVLDVTNDENTSESASETAPAEIETDTTDVSTEASTIEENKTT